MLLRHNRIVIDLGAIQHNYRVLCDSIPENVRIMPVVKANAYGHGAVEVAKAVVTEGATFVAVALVEEGVLLRESGIRADILVLGAAMEDAMETAVKYGLTQTVFDPETLRALNRVAGYLGTKAVVHIKVDTGMNRIGLRTEEEAQALAAALTACEHVEARGIFTHFADADHPLADGGLNDFSIKQLQRFVQLKRFFQPTMLAHAANSASGLIAPCTYFQMVRAGIALYGYPPVPTHLPFQSALSWESEVVQVKELALGDTVGYGRAFTARQGTRIATVAVGYGDGYHRSGGNRAQMLVCGKRANVVGHICMDQTMIDVTGIDGVKVGSPVVLIGAQGNGRIGADELAAWMNTISYEMLLSITNRVHREYIRF